METIRKKICFDKVVSHRNGIMPYIPKDETDSDIHYVETISSESNYGSFACDFALIDSHMTSLENSISYRENVELARLRYADFVSWYGICSEIVEAGHVLRKIKYDENDTDPCNTEKQVQQTGNDSWGWVEDETISKFDCPLVDNGMFVKNANGIYLFKDTNFNYYNELKLKYGDNFENIDEATDDEKDFVDKMNLFVGNNNDGIIYTSNYIFAIDEYDEYLKHESAWNTWWETNWENCSFVNDFDRWEKYVFDPYYSESVSLKFVYDVEKYILGKVKVPESYAGYEISGPKVPKYVYYLNYMDYLAWFVDNELYFASNDAIKKEWNDRGGNGFRKFLFTIKPKFLNILSAPEYGDSVYFGVISPNIEFSLSFCDEFYNETSYVPYEYSVINNNIVDGTMEYIKGGDNKIGSALTPSFITFENGEIQVESKLNTLFGSDVFYVTNEIYGIFNEFTDGGCLFKCTFHSGQSSGQISRYTSGCVKYYAKDDSDDWNEISSIVIPETYEGVMYADVYPKTRDNSYQVVGITEIGSETTVSVEDTIDFPATYYDNGNVKIVSSITIYDKTVVKTYSWCECKKEQNTEDILCGDGENIDFNGIDKYRNLLILSCAPSASESHDEGATYYYMVKYDNGYTNIGYNQQINKITNKKKILKLPYIVGEEKNVETYSGEFSGITKYDMVLNSYFEDDRIIFDYVVGATVGEDVDTSGIHYQDSYIYGGNIYVKTIIDGLYEAEVLYEDISTNNKVTVYDSDLNNYRNCVISKITGMEIGTQWTNKSSINAYLFTDDAFDNLIEYPKISVDISYNRGNAAAWEKHFKLSECNTMSDLEIYGNNYFNL